MSAPIRKRTRYPAQRERAQEILNESEPPPRASVIAARLRREFGAGPDERQVRNWIRDGAIAIEAESAPWTVAHADRPEDIPLVLEVARAFRHPTWWITVAQARWIVRLRRAYPDMDVVEVMDLARHAVREDGLAFTKRLADASP